MCRNRCPRPSVCLLTIASLLVAGAGMLRAWAVEPPPGAAIGVLILRSGEVLRGNIRHEDQRYTVVMEGAEISVKAAEVELVCSSLEQAYAIKRAAMPANEAEGHFDLAEWCLRQKLDALAARELADGVTIDPKHPRAALLERRVAQALTPVAVHQESPSADRDVLQAQNEELDRLVRGMPRGAVETFTNNVQPQLMNSCGTAGCHGPNANNRFSLLRLNPVKASNRRITQRNLQSVLKWMDYASPNDSLLLTAPLKPHGGLRAPIFSDRQASRYRQIYDWVILVTGENPASTTSDLARSSGASAPQGVNKFDVVQTQHLEAANKPATMPLKSPVNASAEEPSHGSQSIIPAYPSANEIPNPLPARPRGEIQPLQPPSVTRPPDPPPTDDFDPDVFNRGKSRLR